MKLRKLHINDYKMFKDFDISFVDENDEALPIVVLAGVNGSGKTSILESMIPYKIKTHSLYATLDKTNLALELKYTKGNSFNSSRELNKYYTDGSIRNIIVYFPASVNQLQDIEIRIVEEYINTAEEIDSFKKALKSLQDKIDDIFIGLDIGFRVSRVDYNKKKVFLSNIDDDREFGMDALSTGEKTLLSKVLLLYFGEYQEKIILIDEPELSLHPSWQNKILKLYENFALKNNCQIIIATHSPHIIGSADNKYIRFLEKNKDGKIIAINDIQAYGRDIEWVLEQMGVKNTRLPKITKRFDEIQELINNEEFDKADEELDKLEYVIGDNDKDILTLRNDLAFERMDFEED